MGVQSLGSLPWVLGGHLGLDPHPVLFPLFPPPLQFPQANCKPEQSIPRIPPPSLGLWPTWVQKMGKVPQVFSALLRRLEKLKLRQPS